MRPSRGVRAGAVGKPPLRKTRRPLVGFRGAPRTLTASTWGGHGFHPARPAFQRPSGLRSMRPPARPKPCRGPPALSCPFRGVRRSPVRSRRPVGRLVGPHNLSWAFFALRHTLGTMARDDRGSTRDPPAACGGLATPCATSPSPLPAREAPERPWASPFRAFPPCAAVPPCGGPALLALPAPAPHREVHARTQPPSGPCSRHGSVRHRPLRAGRRCPPGVPPSRAFAPSVRAQRFDRAASPRTPLTG